MAASLFVPIAYVVVLVTALGIFSSIYRRRKAAAVDTEPWFPSHPARDLYITLVGAQDPPTPEPLLKAALLLRAMEDVKRIMKMRDQKQALTVLIQKGSVGDSLYNRFLVAEKQLESEILDVVNEANSFTPAWGPAIFGTASEMVAAEKQREDIEPSHSGYATFEAKWKNKSGTTFQAPSPATTPLKKPAQLLNKSPASTPVSTPSKPATSQPNLTIPGVNGTPSTSTTNSNETADHSTPASLNGQKSNGNLTAPSPVSSSKGTPSKKNKKKK